ncbi:MAG: relaxase/mobilization nuclease domain-containing protein [Cyanobacteria bacterium P01_D01_bin.105]
MIIKVIRGSSAYGLCRYVLDPRKQLPTQQAIALETDSAEPFLLCAGMPGQKAHDFARNLNTVAKLNQRVQKTVAHYSISLPEGDRERISHKKMVAMTKSLLYQMGHARCPYFAVEHHDASQKHWHVVVSAVTYGGDWVDGRFDRYRLRTVEENLEQQFRLTSSRRRPVADIKNLSAGEYRIKGATGQVLPKEKLWAAVDSCLGEDQSLARFILKLKARFPEVSVQLRERDSRKVGISFGIDGKAFAGRHLGRAYSLNGLQQYHQIRYEPDSQPGILDEILSMDTKQCQQLYQQWRLLGQEKAEEQAPKQREL